MCGIFGFTNFRPNQLERARAALHTLTHRGPDQWGDFAQGQIYMGHRRLSILDLSEHGRQPMASADGRVIICVNGEIYNYGTLREELGLKYSFRSTSDSEVVLYGYKEWGIDGLLERIDGMFAFAIYDLDKQFLYLVRDRVGIKPLFYSTLDGGICWASELKALVQFYGEEQLIRDNTALYDFLTYQYIPAPKTLYERCFKLEPACYLSVDLSDGRVDKIRYWRLAVKDDVVDVEVAGKKIREKLMKSVKEQMVSDVPVGFFLSGGLDSSAVVASAAAAKTQLNTYSIGFTDAAHDETHFADSVAVHFGTLHRKSIIDEETVSDLFTKLKDWYDEPYGDLSCFPTYLVSTFAKQDVTVVLTGDGGDELFGGYKWYSRFKWINRFSLRNAPLVGRILGGMFRASSVKLNKYVALLSLGELPLYAKLMGGLTSEEKAAYRAKWGIEDDYDDYWYYRQYYKKDLPIYTRLQYLDFHTYLPDDILTKVDRVSMAVALECRVPFLSRDLIEFAFSISEKTRLHKYGLKGAMKVAFEKVLPDNIINRGKKGFSIPVSRVWKRKVMGGYPNRFQKILQELFQLEA